MAVDDTSVVRAHHLRAYDERYEDLATRLDTAISDARAVTGKAQGVVSDVQGMIERGELTGPQGPVGPVGPQGPQGEKGRDADFEASDKATAGANKAAKNAATATSEAKEAAADARKAAEEARGAVSADMRIYFKRVTDANGDTRPVLVDTTI